MALQQIDQGLFDALVNYIDYPQYFAEDILNAKLERWQFEGLEKLGTNDRVAVRSGHGVGKTAFESMAILWFLSTRPYPKVPCTAPTQQQLFDVLWAEVAKWIDRVPAMKQIFEWHKTRIVNRDYPERWFATPRTSNKPENLAGFHEDHIMFVVDEASGVADPIFETIEGALTTVDAKLLICGNPTKTSGVFYQAFHKNRSEYHAMKVSVQDVSPERVDPKYLERLIRQYGADSDVVRVRGYGEFPKAEPDTFIALEYCEAAAMREVYERDRDGNVRYPNLAPLEIGADIARFGDDETVIVGRIGARMAHMETHTRQDTMTTTGQIVAACRMLLERYGRKKIRAKIDDDGVGGGVTDRLVEMIQNKELDFELEVVRCGNGRSPSDEEKENYENWGTEAWADIRQMLHQGEIEIINDDDLIAQLSTRKYRMTSKGKIALERKEDMKKRGLRSPDRADATVLAFADKVLPEIVFDKPTAVTYQDIMSASYFDQLG